MKRILPCLFAVALFGAACGGDPSSETSAESTDASESDSSTDATSTGETDAVPAAEGQAPADDPASDGAGVDWPLSFSGELVDGSQFDSGDYAGQDLVLWFWAPW